MSTPQRTSQLAQPAAAFMRSPSTTPDRTFLPAPYEQQQACSSFSTAEQLSEYRQFWQHLSVARSSAAASERYDALMWLINHCRASLMALPINTPWSKEPAISCLHDLLEVGEALASFGSCRFPEHSNESRAILAADFKRLMQEYLSKLGSVFVPGVCRDLPKPLENKLLTVGSKLDTRCSTYNLLFDQLVSAVGREGKGSASAIVINAPTTSITANPHNSVTANPVNTASASAQSKSKAVNRGMGAAAVAAAGLLGLVLMRAMRGGGGGGGGRGGSGKGSKGSRSDKDGHGSSGRRLRLPRDKAGREMVLVGQLSSCADEMRKAATNESLLKDDWRFGRMRLAWPPAPEPQGYQNITYDACNVTQLLQDMYGR